MRKKSEVSPLFKEIFKEDSTTYRGVSLGMPVSKISEMEGKSTIHKDIYGLVYQIPLSGGGKLISEYYHKPSTSDTDPEILSIIGNIYLTREADAIKLYREISQIFQARYGIFEGSFGSQIWKPAGRNIEVLLRLNEDKRSLTVNFLKPEVE